MISDAHFTVYLFYGALDVAKDFKDHGKLLQRRIWAGVNQAFLWHAQNKCTRGNDFDMHVQVDDDASFLLVYVSLNVPLFMWRQKICKVL